MTLLRPILWCLPSEVTRREPRSGALGNKDHLAQTLPCQPLCSLEQEEVDPWDGQVQPLTPGKRQGEELRAEVSFRKLVRELGGWSLVDSQGVRCLRAACRDFLRKVVLSSTA